MRKSIRTVERLKALAAPRARGPERGVPPPRTDRATSHVPEHPGADRSRTPSQRRLTAAPRPVREQRSPTPRAKASQVFIVPAALLRPPAAPRNRQTAPDLAETESDLRFSRWALEDLNL